MTVAMPSHRRKGKHGVLLLHGEPENAMKRRKALLSEEELIVRKERDKVSKASKRASETCEQTLHRQEKNQTQACSSLVSLRLFSYPSICNVILRIILHLIFQGTS